jgi:serine/threonine protein kinase/tetratricopeptide (TPR) repeat protein
MGEVYRARDTELEREVAVKVLPTRVAKDPDRLERFQREARAVAALSHPNILEIYDVGTHTGIQYAVTELLEGQTLRERLPGKGMPWQKVADIGAGIAEGLAAAHGKGIIHRDLKPENVFVTSDGRVKVLDFGLARIKAEISTEAETGTLTPAGTVSGTIMGTPGYMAPEQVRGKPADHRSDIFALGCVLYEMVAGRRAFGGDTAPDIMAAILKEEPPRPSAAGATLPIDLERTIHRCLEKSPEARFQSAADLAYNLRSTATGAVVPMATPTGEIRPVTRRWWPIAVAVGMVVAAASVVAWLSLRPGKESFVEAPAPSQISQSPFLDEWRVAVEPFDNRSGNPALETVGRTLTDRLMEGLARIGQGLEDMPSVTVLAADASGGGADGGPSRNVGRLLVTGFYSDRGSALDVTVQVRDPDTRGVLYSTGQVEVSRRAAEAELVPLLEKAMGAVATHARIRLQNVSHVPDYAVFREYVGGLDDWAARADTGEVNYVARAFELDPEYLEPAFRMAGNAIAFRRIEEAESLLDHIRARRQRLTEYENLWLTSLEAFRDGALARALQAVREMRRIAPHELIVRYAHARFARDLGNHEEVVETLADVIERLPPSYVGPRGTMGTQLMRSYHELGRYEESLALARHLRHEFPGETRMYAFEANALAALGQLDELAETVSACEGVPGGECDAAFVLSQASWRLAAYGHRDAARSYGLRSVELYRSRIEGGDTRYSGFSLSALRAAELWDEYRQFARSRSEGSEEGTDAHEYFLCAVGMASAHLGDRAEAEAIMARFVSRENFIYAGYVAAHLGELDRAVEFLKRGVASTSGPGYDQFARWDLDLEPLWDYPPFKELVGWDD